jgi:2,3-bisphosphoglycerate-independent phosphoglycerate mutase
VTVSRACRVCATAVRRGVTDEFIEPVHFEGGRGSSRRHGVFFNFRPDRARQLSQRLLEAGFDLTTMTRYRDDLDCPVVFDEQEVANTLAEVLAANGARQLHCAETEKYAHVTYFLNGGREDEWAGETADPRPEPARVGTYDKKPEMSAAKSRIVSAPRSATATASDRQLREPGHGRAHGLDPRGDRRL